VNDGEEFAVLATGNMLHTGATVVSRLKREGLSPIFVSMHTLKPLDEEFVKKTAARVKVIYTLEEHSRIGGLGDAVSSVIADSGSGCRVRKFSLKDQFVRDVGSKEYLRDIFGLSAEKAGINSKDYSGDIRRYKGY